MAGEKASVELSHLERLALGIMLTGSAPPLDGADIVAFTFKAGLKEAIGENGYNGLRDFADRLRKKGLFAGKGDTYFLTAEGYEAGQAMHPTT
ncbi:MAG: hypothetical protein HYT16_01070 [DPANN group archaeon]|nr:hypothetical protein [DPANN group archaeon]